MLYSKINPPFYYYFFKDEIENKGAVVFDYTDLTSDPGTCTVVRR